MNPVAWKRSRVMKLCAGATLALLILYLILGGSPQSPLDHRSVGGSEHWEMAKADRVRIKFKRCGNAYLIGGIKFWLFAPYTFLLLR